MTSTVSARERSLWPASLRLRLTLWNVGVLALMLAALGIGLRCTLQATLIASVDRSLLRGSRSFQARVDAVGLTHGPYVWPPAPPDANNPHPTPAPDRLPPLVFDLRGHCLFPHPGAVPYDPEALARAQEGQTVVATVPYRGQPTRLRTVSLQHNGRLVGVAQVGRPLTETNEEISHLTDVLLWLAVPGLLIAGCGGLFLTSRALRPVRLITRAAGRIEAEDLSGRLPVSGRDELSQLAATFNGMLGRLEEAFGQRAAAYTQMERAYADLEAANASLERAYEQQRRFTADASHELKTPLTVIEGTVSLALSGQRTADQYRQSLDRVGRSAEIMTKIVQDLLLLARSDAGEFNLDRRPVSVADVLALARESVSAREHAPITVSPIAPDVFVSGDPSHLVRLFVNLLDNAVRHTPCDGRIELSAVGSAASVTVTVRDTGAGIAPEHLPHVFERFYRADAARARRHGGSGLGLAICQSIVEVHGGDITLDSVPGEGTTVHIRLPRAALIDSPAAPTIREAATV